MLVDPENYMPWHIKPVWTSEYGYEAVQATAASSDR